VSKTTDKALSIISSFTLNTPYQSVDQLTKKTNLPQSTLYRFLQGLSKTGYVIQNIHGTYQLGPTVLQLGRIAEAGYEVRTLAVPLMDSLWERDWEKTISLWVRFGDSRLCIESRERKGGGIKYSIHPGETLPIYAGAAGKVLLAFMEQSAAKELLKRVRFKKITPLTPTHPQKLLEEMSIVRNKGFAYSEGEVYQGTYGFSAPLFNSRGLAEAALAISGILEIEKKDRRKELPDLLLEVSNKISKDMGYQGG